MTAIIRLGDILQAAVSKGNLDRVRELLEKGAPVNERGEHGTTALHWAASNDEAEIVRSLLQAGANPDARAVDGCTPLHYAAREDAAAATAMLLRFGADCRVTNNAGRVAEEEIYDDQDDGEGTEIARLLAEAARLGGARARLSSANDEGEDRRRRGGESGGGAARLSSVGASTGATFSSLEFAMADMAALLRVEKAGKSPPKSELYPTPARASSSSTAEGERREEDEGQGVVESTGVRVGSGGVDGDGGGGSVSVGGGAETPRTATSSTFGGGGDRVIVPRAYVPAANHDDVTPRMPEARAVLVRLRADGTLSDEDYRAVRQSYMETGLPRVDPQARTASCAPGIGGASYYHRIPEVAHAKLEARRREGAGVGKPVSKDEQPVLVSSGCGDGGCEE